MIYTPEGNAGEGAQAGRHALSTRTRHCYSYTEILEEGDIGFTFNKDETI